MTYNMTESSSLLFYTFKTLTNILSTNAIIMVFITKAQTIYSYGIETWGGTNNLLATTFNSPIETYF